MYIWIIPMSNLSTFDRVLKISSLTAILLMLDVKAKQISLGKRC
jgi:hypothetical protein